MTNPQKENGYTPICNEVLEAIYQSPFNATQLKIVMVICRYTYGFSRKEHSISETFISKAVNVSKRYISSELSKLVEQNVILIIKPHTDTTSRVLALNKHYDEWLVKTIVQQVNNTSTGEQLISTTGEQYINTPVEQSFYQDKQTLKQNLKQDTLIKKPIKVIENFSENILLDEAIKEFIKMRKFIKKPISPGGIKLMIKKLNGFSNNDVDKITILNNSIENSWQGIFELKGNSKTNKTSNDWSDF